MHDEVAVACERLVASLGGYALAVVEAGDDAGRVVPTISQVRSMGLPTPRQSSRPVVGATSSPNWETAPRRRRDAGRAYLHSSSTGPRKVDRSAVASCRVTVLLGGVRAA